MASGLGDITSASDHEPRRSATTRAAHYASPLLVGLASFALLVYQGQLDPVSIGILAAAVVASLAVPLSRGHGKSGHLSAREQPSRNEDLLSNIPDPVILVDARILVRDANRAANDLLPGLKVNNPLSFALRAPHVLDGIGEALRSGQAQMIEYRPRIPTERVFEVHVSVVKPTEPEGTDRLRALLFLRDLTSARRLENMRVDFVANASHELRTPLASVLGFIETLQGPARNDPLARERFLEIMRGQALRMSRLIDDLLSLSRIELRMHVHPNTAVDLLSIVRQMIDSMGPLVRERGLELSLQSDGAPYEILGDRDELMRLVENLVDNAAKYGESGKKVDLALTRISTSNGRNPHVDLTVRDYGPGISPEHLPRLTERFYRADNGGSRHKGGTGLGLAIVKHIVVRHRGRLHIESEPGQGATFRVSFPGAPASTS